MDKHPLTAQYEQLKIKQFEKKKEKAKDLIALLKNDMGMIDSELAAIEVARRDTDNTIESLMTSDRRSELLVSLDDKKRKLQERQVNSAESIEIHKRVIKDFDTHIQQIKSDMMDADE